jgi:dTDP-glucose pyrophosphorylase|tara:strand:+ start:1249 stop:2310 length:1062 start_codon:yes stop_codon:yes gene_type:complete
MTNKNKINLIKSTDTLKNAMKKLEKSKYKCLIIVDKNEKLIGTITDGDIRRALLKGAKFDGKVKKYCFKTPFYINNNFKNRPVKKIYSNRSQDRFDLIPVVDNKKKILSIMPDKQFLELKKRFYNTLNPIPVVIMAGGKGTRLLPHTSVLPKPLLPINDKSMIENIIERFSSFGFNNFYITINYKSELLNIFFKNLSKRYKIKIINEKIPLGTAGSLALLKKKINKDFFVINCDSLIHCDYSLILNFHKQNNFDLTLVVSKKDAVLPYGLCKINKKGNLIKIQEKPKIDFLANTGFYIFKKKCLHLIPKNKNFDMNLLIEKLIKRKKNVGVYPIDKNEWQDFGNWQEFGKFQR